MANKGVLALTTDGRITYCTCDPANRGKGRCNHVAHAQDGESEADFIERVNSQIVTEEDTKDKPSDYGYEENPITHDEVKQLREKIYELCGRRDVNMNNIKEVLESLPLEKQREIMEIGFEQSKYFAFPITDDNYEQEGLKTQIYFGNMGDFGLGAKKSHINEILSEIGTTVTEKGEAEIKNCYKKGLTDEEWWTLQYSTRMASVNKTVSISAPGAEARNLFYGLSDTIMIDDCGDDSSTGILSCHAPGGFCEKCARKSGMSKALDTLKKGCPDKGISGIRIGGFVSTNLSEPLTQSYLNAIHGANDPKANQHKVLVNTFDCYQRSPIIQDVLKETTTEGRRKVLCEKLKEAYKDQGIDIDDYNIEIVAKKMTSYKRGKNGLEFVKDGELCDIVSIKSIGNRGNIFKKASIGSSYKTLSVGGKFRKNKYDAFEDFMPNKGNDNNDTGSNNSSSNTSENATNIDSNTMNTDDTTNN